MEVGAWEMRLLHLFPLPYVDVSKVRTQTKCNSLSEGCGAGRIQLLCSDLPSLVSVSYNSIQEHVRRRGAGDVARSARVRFVALTFWGWSQWL